MIITVASFMTGFTTIQAQLVVHTMLAFLRCEFTVLKLVGIGGLVGTAYQVADIGVLLHWAEVGVRVGIVGVVVVGLVTGGTWLQLVCCALV